MSQQKYTGVIWYSPMAGGLVNLTLMLYIPNSDAVDVGNFMTKHAVAAALRQGGLEVHSTHAARRFVGAVVVGNLSNVPPAALRAVKKGNIVPDAQVNWRTDLLV